MTQYRFISWSSLDITPLYTISCSFVFLFKLWIRILSEKVEVSIEVAQVIVASKRLYGLTTFTFYAISDGLKSIFSKSYVGIQSFFIKDNVEPSLQMSLFDCS